MARILMRHSSRAVSEAIVAAIVTGLAVIGVASLAGMVLPTSGDYAVKAAAAFAAVAAVAVFTLRASHPYSSYGPANVMTTARAGGVALVVALLGEPKSDALAAALVVTASIAAALDGVDGWLARRSGIESAFGARFDMEVDALLILALAALTWQHEKAGAWVLFAGVMRYAFVAASWIWGWLAAPLPPSQRRKAICVVQIVGLIVAVAPIVTPPLSTVVAALSLAALTWSFLVDVVWLWRARAAAAGRA